MQASLLSRLKHPNIVSYRESFQDKSCVLHIVMGYCEGGDLSSRLKAQQGCLLPEAQVVEWFVQICLALQVCAIDWTEHCSHLPPPSSTSTIETFCTETSRWAMSSPHPAMNTSPLQTQNIFLSRHNIIKVCVQCSLPLSAVFMCWCAGW